MVSIYNEIIKKAWQIFWHNKFLWFFGLFLIFIGQEIETLLRNYYMHAEGTLSLDSWQELFKSGFGKFFENIWDTFSSTTLGGTFSLILFLVVAVLLIWLIIISVGAIIYNTVQAGNGKKITFQEGFSAGKKYFWKNFIVYIFTKGIDYLFLIVFGLVASLTVFGIFNSTVSALMIILSFIVSLLLAFVAKYAACYIVVRGQNLGQAIRSGWRLFIKNVLASIEMAIVVFLINLIINLALLLVLVIIAVPFFLLILILGQSDFAGFGTVLLWALTAILIIIVMFVSAMLSSFQFSAWTLFFQKLDEGKKASKIMQLAERLSGRK